VINAQAPQATNGKNHVGIMFGSQTAVSSNGKSQESPAGGLYVRNGVELEKLYQMGLGFCRTFTSPGGPYSGPVISDVTKSIKEVHMGSPAIKRKDREGALDQIERTTNRRERKKKKKGKNCQR
jgi:hypothetical protein